MKATIKVFSNGISADHDLSTDEVLIIGRSRSSDLSLADEKVSSRHCRLFFKTHRMEISDLDSKNGTYLNGIRIERSEVFIGDEIKIGESILKLEANNMSKEAIGLLTFPGNFKDRIGFELRADFTGARLENQLNFQKEISRFRFPSKDKEIEIRKKVKSRLKLSKEEVKNRNKKCSHFSYILDLLIFLAVMLVPAVMLNHLPPTDLDRDERFTFFLLLGVGSLIIFYIINYKLMKFTLGEKLAGIQKLYEEQC